MDAEKLTEVVKKINNIDDAIALYAWCIFEERGGYDRAIIHEKLCELLKIDKENLDFGLPLGMTQKQYENKIRDIIRKLKEDEKSCRK